MSSTSIRRGSRRARGSRRTSRPIRSTSTRSSRSSRTPTACGSPTRRPPGSSPWDRPSTSSSPTVWARAGETRRPPGRAPGGPASPGLHPCQLDRAPLGLLRAAGLPGRLGVGPRGDDVPVSAAERRALRRGPADEDPRAGGERDRVRERRRADRGAQAAAPGGAGGAERGRAGRDRARAGVGRRGGHRGLLPAVRLRPHGRGGRRDVHAGDPGGAGAPGRLQLHAAGAAGPAGRGRRVRGHRRARPAARPRLRRRGARGHARDRLGHRAVEEGGRAGGGADRAGLAVGRRRLRGRRGGLLLAPGGGGRLMHLKSITLKGFKSFPDRTRLEFGEGVSVIVGPNGSGKSNVTDAVLWALGEQSPLAVRGQSMQDVIFGGGRGVQARSSAEVELVLDNGGGSEAFPMSEISILRRLDRNGEGEYRLNGARCRLVDVLEVLSDTGLGKEMHSVISQGRVEAIVTSKPRDRRLLIEEAAGLGKHRKRRRRAQLKLERTQDNLDRALDVEREARSRLRPLKRQAEAAELHARLERQTLEARWSLARDDARVARAALVEAEAAAAAARAARDETEGRLAE